MAFLYCAYYINTNSQEVIGIGSGGFLTGNTKYQCMLDGCFSEVINFWGLEAWYDGGKFEYFDDVSISEREVSVNLDNGESRVIGTMPSPGWISKMKITENLDLLVSAANGSATTWWCDSSNTGYSGLRMIRDIKKNDNRTGIFAHGAHGSTPNVSNIGTRLCYRGDYIIE